MSDYVILDGDLAIFHPVFGTAEITPLPGRIRGSGPAKSSSRKVCVAGDERSVSVPGCAYICPPYLTPGVGTLSIQRLATNQQASDSETGGKPMLLVGGAFTAVFKVTAPATIPPPTLTPDPLPQYIGRGNFQTSNHSLKAD